MTHPRSIASGTEVVGGSAFYIKHDGQRCGCAQSTCTTRHGAADYTAYSIISS
jgi:hypothetical protein